MVVRCFFFSALPLRDGDVGERRKRSSSLARDGANLAKIAPRSELTSTAQKFWMDVEHRKLWRRQVSSTATAKRSDGPTPVILATAEQWINARSPDRTSFGTAGTPEALRMPPPVASQAPRRLLSSTPFQSSSGECRIK